MSRKFKIVVHIGTEKTGSTTLQHSLQHNHELLASRGIHYLATPGRVEARAFAAACLDDQAMDDYLRDQSIDTPEQRQVFRKKYRGELQAKLHGLPKHIEQVVISSEHFHSRLRRPAEVRRVKDWLSPFASSFRIVCYLRRQVDVAASYYSTVLKNGGTISLEESARRLCRPNNHYTHYQVVLDLWSSIFGNEAITLKRFDRDTLRGGSIVNDFWHLLGLDIDQLEEFKPIAPHNESLTPVGQALLRQMNRRTDIANSGLVDEAEWRQARQRVIAAYAGSGEQLPPKLAMELQQRFDESNEAVRKKWFPEESTLFDRHFETSSRCALSAEQESALEGLFDTLLSARIATTPDVIPDSLAPEMLVREEHVDGNVRHGRSESRTTQDATLTQPATDTDIISVQHRALQATCPELAAWCLDFPASGQDLDAGQALTAGILFQGWALAVSGNTLEPFVRYADRIYRITLAQARADVVRRVLGDEPEGHAQLVCGFRQMLPVDARHCVFGIRSNGQDHDLLELLFTVVNSL